MKGKKNGRSGNEILGQIIAHERKRQKISQIALARDVDIAQSFLCRIERGRQWPSEVTLRHIAKRLGLASAFLQRYDPRRRVSRLASAALKNPIFLERLERAVRRIE